MQKNEAAGKAASQEEGDHGQPMNLAAPRMPVPPATTFANLSNPMVNQPVTLRPTTDASKPSLMTLYFRSPTNRPPGPGHIMSPVVGTHAQHFPKQAFKNLKGLKVGYYQQDKLTDKSGSEVNIKVIRMPPNEGSQTSNISALQSGAANMATGVTSRHIAPTAMHPALSAACAGSSGQMASIIKGTSHGVSQVSHVIHQPYPSHVPRGPAAVASISAAPKSAVATPILRAPHSSNTMTLSSSMARSPTLASGRTATPPVSTAIGSHPQVIDFQKSSVGHPLTCGPTQIGLVTRSLEGPGMRPGFVHSPSIAIAKPISISSQPIVQHLQQVSEKGYLKSISGISTTAPTSNLTPAHQSVTTSGVMAIGHAPSAGTEMHLVPTITRSTVTGISAPAAYATGIVQLPHGASLPQHIPLRPSLVQPQVLHSSAGSAGAPSGLTTVQPHQTYTVISAKTLSAGNQPVALAAPLARPAALSSGTIVPSTVVSSTSSLSQPRSLSSQNTLGSTIPVAKVYPQQLPSVSQVCIETSSTIDNVRTSTFVTQTSVLSGATSALSAAMTATTASLPQTIVIADKRTDSSTAVRFTSLGKPNIGTSGASFTVPSHYVYDQYGGALAVHPYSVSSANQNFAAALSGTQLRPLALSQHGNSNITSVSHSSVCLPANSSASGQPINSLMVAVDSRHVALHPQFSSIGVGNKTSSADIPPHLPATGAPAHLPTTSLSSLTSVGTGHVTMAPAHPNMATTHASIAQQQGNNQNHVSPRPSILRKRTTEVIGSVAKRNLIPTLCATEAPSLRSEVVSSFSAPSPPKSSDLQRDNGALPGNQENSGAPMTAQKFHGVAALSAVKEESVNESNVLEALPRKKPRKQLLAANELMESNLCDHENKSFERDVKPNIKDIKMEDDSVKWVTFCKRPSMSLLGNYRHGWKARNNHFMRYSDVRPKEEKKLSVNEIANQKNVTQEANGWKVFHLTAQMEDLNDYEESVFARLSHWVDLEEKSSFTKFSNTEDVKILTKLTDLVKGNLQRSKIAQEQATESRQQILKIIDHKPKILDILAKNVNRRPLKKKDKS